MILKEIIQRVQSLYSRGVQSDDTRLSNRHIYSKVKTTRAKLLSQQLNKKQKVSQWNYQTLPCVKLIKVPSHECPCLPPVGCSILRSEHKIPEPVSSIFGDAIEWVRTIEKSIKIDRVSINALNSQKGNKYTSKKLQYFIENGYLYISTPTNIQIVSFRALFEDPIAVEDFMGYCDECPECSCTDYMEIDYPIDNDMVETLIELAVNELVILFSQNVEDATNNTRDSIKEQSK